MTHLDERVAYALARDPDGCRAADLAALLGEAQRDVKAALDRLEAAGVVERAGTSKRRGGSWHRVDVRVPR